MLLALLAAVFLAVGIVVRQRATIDVPALPGNYEVARTGASWRR